MFSGSIWLISGTKKALADMKEAHGTTAQNAHITRSSGNRVYGNGNGTYEVLKLETWEKDVQIEENSLDTVV